MKPIQYQRGWVEFFKLKFKVTPDVLIPRPETELLVEEVLMSLRALRAWQSITILDVGTGAGNIAISIAKNLASHTSSGNVKIIATDISEKALKVARQNAKLHGVEDKITFIQANLLTVIPSKEGIQNSNWIPHQVRDDNLIIVTNLPYIPTARINYLDSSVKDFEPHVALDGGKDGFELYRKLFAQIKTKIYVLPKAKGKVLRASSKIAEGKLRVKQVLIIGEIDYTHGELAVKEAQKYFPESQIEVKTDLSHRQRILTITH